MTLPSFSTEEDDDNDTKEDDNDDDEEEEEDTEEEEEVNFPKQGTGQCRRQTVQPGKQPRTPIAAKNLNFIRASRREKKVDLLR